MEREKDKEAAAQLAEALGNLPLALEQAGAYVARAGLSLPEYLELFRKHQQEHAPRRPGSDDYPASLATTFEIAFLRLASESPAAADLLTLCAFLAPDEIPLEIFEEASGELPPSLAAVAANPEALSDLAATLQSYSLAKVRGGSFLSFHHFVQSAARDRLSEDDRTTWSQAAVQLMNTAFPFRKADVQTWVVSAPLLQHALTATEWARELQGAWESVSELLNRVGLYLLNNAEFAKAKSAFEQALQADELLFGPDHQNVAVCLNNLGEVLREQGDLDGARSNFERALTIDEATYGPEHPDVATDLNNLGLVLRTQGDFEGARANYQRALAIDEATYGPEHPDVAIDLNNLSQVMREQGDLEGARANLERAIAIDEATYGPEHPQVAIRLNNLGLILQAEGDLEGARANLERALAINELLFGPERPPVATSLNNLGEVLRAQGDLDGARSNFERALAIDEATYGPEHPDVAIDLNNIGFVLQAEGDLEGARANFERALAILRKFLGERHPTTLIVQGNLEGLKRTEE